MCSVLHRSDWSQLPIPNLILLFHSLYTFSLVWKELQEGCYTKMSVNQKLALTQFLLPALRNRLYNHQGNLSNFFFKTPQNRILAEDCHGINQFPSTWNKSRRTSLPCFFIWILALAFYHLPDIHAGSGELDCLTRSSYTGSCAKAHGAYNGKLMSWGRGEAWKGGNGKRLSTACSFFQTL